MCDTFHETMQEPTLNGKIETLVRSRDIPEARKKIRVYLRKTAGSLLGRTNAAEWYRRLGLFREAYLTVAPDEWRMPAPGSSLEETDRFVWTAYFLDLQGASGYAVDILKRLQPESLAALSIAGTIQMSNGRYAEAVESFRRYFSRVSVPETYAQKMLRISLADAYAGLGKFLEAREELLKVKAERGERLLSGILEQVSAEYFAREGKFAEALEGFTRAVEFFPPGEGTVDSAFLDKWRGVSLAGLGRREEARAAFLRSEVVLSRPDYRPEMLLDLYYRMEQADLLDSERALLLSVYPGLSEAFKKRRGLHPLTDWVGDSNARFRIYPSRDEWWVEGKARLGIPLEIRLLSLVRLTAPIGLSAERLKPLLWPEDVASFLQLDDRIAKLLKRLRSEYALDLRIEAGRIRVDEKVRKQVAVEIGNEPRPWTFLDLKPEFEADEFASYYGLGRTIAFQRLTEELEKGRLSKRKDGRRVLYRVDL